MGKIYKFDCVTSTFDKLTEYQPEHLLTVVAKTQTSGCGRRGRNWQSDQGGLYFSTVLDAKYFDEIGFSTIVCAVAVANVLSEYGKCSIKWPNDIVMDGKKICGILTKIASDNGTIRYINAGIGINTNTSVFDPTLTYASSVLNITGKKCNNDILLEKILTSIEQCISMPKAEIMKRYRKFCITIGSDVIIHNSDGTDFECKCTEVTDNGELIVETDGKTITINSGEVSVRGLYGYV